MLIERGVKYKDGRLTPTKSIKKNVFKIPHAWLALIFVENAKIRNTTLATITFQ